VLHPENTDKIPANQGFTITMAIKNMETGNFVNPQTNYFSAPQQVNGQGTLIGHSHVVVQKMAALDDDEILDPETFGKPSLCPIDESTALDLLM
jgi:hypothetical protein